MENIFDGNPSVAAADNRGSILRQEVIDDLWGRCLIQLRQEIDEQIFDAFIAPLRPQSIDMEKNEIMIVAPSRLILVRVEDGFKDKIAKHMSELLGSSSFMVKVAVDPNLAGAPETSMPQPIIIKKTRAVDSRRAASTAQFFGDFESGINPKYTFSSFVVGNSNQFCHAAALRVSESPGESYNPLFIYGGVGLGKTHLLHAIGNAVLASRPRARVLYLSSEAFTNELIQSLRYAKMDEFKAKLRNIEVLLIDDIQFMCGKERTQEEFFHTFNALYNAKRQIVITSDKVPQDIPGIEERLQTRFSWGLTADLQAPDFETRVAILKRKALLDGFAVPEEIVRLIAEKVHSNIRELEGAMTRVQAMSSLQGRSVTLELASQALSPLLQPKSVRVTVADIKRVVAEHFGIKVSDMISKRRTKNLSFPRHIGMYLSRKHTTCSYMEIGSHFGGRDHSSVIHAANVVSSKLDSDGSVRSLVADLERKLLQE